MQNLRGSQKEAKEQKEKITLRCPMINNQIIFVRLLKISFVALFLLTGCSTASKKTSLSVPKQEAKRDITSDVLVFRDLQSIDLDKDGTQEIVAVYTTAENSSGVKVIKIRNNWKGDIIFNRIFNTPNIKFEVLRGVPAIISEQIDSGTGCKLRRIYRWDGKAFSLE